MRNLKSLFLLLYLVLLLTSCESIDSSRTSNKIGKTTEQNSNGDLCSEHMQKFLTWYIHFFEGEGMNVDFIASPKFDDSYAISPQNPDNISLTGYYMINHKNLDKYLNILEKSGYFSKAYLDAKRKDILIRGKVLEAAKQENGPPEGFDFDEVFRAQEMYEPEHIKNLRAISSIKGAYALPVVEGYGWILYTKYENGACVIDSIGRLNPD